MILEKDYKKFSFSKILALSIVIHIVLILVSFLLLYFDKRKKEQNTQYEKLIEDDLPETPKSKMLYNKTFTDNGIMAFSFGILYAMMFTTN